MMKGKLTHDKIQFLIGVLKNRFENNMQRHPNINWQEVEERLTSLPEKLAALNAMEETGGEPDVVDFDKATGEYIFYDCAPESPKDRRSLCYDQKALESRKQNKPVDSAMNMALVMGITLLTEEQYRYLQTVGDFDTKTSSWVATPENIRQQGGAIFCDRRYNHVFTYHNGAESYYAARGFRGMLKV